MVKIVVVMITLIFWLLVVICFSFFFLGRHISYNSVRMTVMMIVWIVNELTDNVVFDDVLIK